MSTKGIYLPEEAIKGVKELPEDAVPGLPAEQFLKELLFTEAYVKALNGDLDGVYKLKLMEAAGWDKGIIPWVQAINQSEQEVTDDKGGVVGRQSNK